MESAILWHDGSHHERLQFQQIYETLVHLGRQVYGGLIESFLTRYRGLTHCWLAAIAYFWNLQVSSIVGSNLYYRLHLFTREKWRLHYSTLCVNIRSGSARSSVNQAKHRQRVFDTQMAHKQFPWVHMASSQAKFVQDWYKIADRARINSQ